MSDGLRQRAGKGGSAQPGQPPAESYEKLSRRARSEMEFGRAAAGYGISAKKVRAGGKLLGFVGGRLMLAQVAAFAGHFLALHFGREDLAGTLDDAFRFAVGLFYFCAGVMHFTHEDTFLALMPRWLPLHVPCVYISGIAEMLGGLMLLVPATVEAGVLLLLALLVAVYPANINMLWDRDARVRFGAGEEMPLVKAIVRIPIQFVFVYFLVRILKLEGGASAFPEYVQAVPARLSGVLHG